MGDTRYECIVDEADVNEEYSNFVTSTPEAVKLFEQSDPDTRTRLEIVLRLAIDKGIEMCGGVVEYDLRTEGEM